MKFKAFLPFAATALLMASTTTAQANSTFSYSGKAYAVNAIVDGISVKIANTGQLPSKGGTIEKNLDVLNLDLLSIALLPSLPIERIQADLLHTKTSGGGAELWQKKQANTLAEVANVDIPIAGAINLKATAVKVTSHVHCDVSGADYGQIKSLTGNSQILNLTINNTPVTVTGTSNQVVLDKALLGLKVKIVVNERIKSIPAKDRGSIAINGI